MAEEVQVSCITKRGEHLNPHERIERLGGLHNGKRWNMREDDVIAELEKPSLIRQWSFFTKVNGVRADVVVAEHERRKYLKTTADGYAPNNLLNLADCPI